MALRSIFKKIGAVFVLIFLTSCSGLLYHPTKEIYFDPKKLNVKYDDVWFASDENHVRLHGMYLHNKMKKEPKAVIIFFHGNGENMTSHFTTLLWVLEEGYDYFVFDYQGYGESEGEPSPRGTVLDSAAALSWVDEHVPHKIPRVVYAQSLGGAVALKTIIDTKGKVPLDLVVVDSTFSSYKAAARAVLRHSWITWLLQPITYITLSDKYAPDDDIKKISPVPLVVMHGDQDQIIDYSLGEKVFSLAGEPKEFWKIEGGYHTDGFWRHGTTYRNKFLAKLSNLKKKDFAEVPK